LTTRIPRNIYHARPERIAFDISAASAERLANFHRLAAVSTSPEHARTTMSAMVPLRVTLLDPRGKRSKVAE